MDPLDLRDGSPAADHHRHRSRSKCGVALSARSCLPVLRADDDTALNPLGRDGIETAQQGVGERVQRSGVVDHGCLRSEAQSLGQDRRDVLLDVWRGCRPDVDGADLPRIDAGMLYRVIHGFGGHGNDVLIRPADRFLAGRPTAPRHRRFLLLEPVARYIYPISDDTSPVCLLQLITRSETGC